MIANVEAGAHPAATQENTRPLFLSVMGLHPDVPVPWWPATPAADDTAQEHDVQLRAEWAVRLPEGRLWCRSAAVRPGTDTGAVAVFDTRIDAERERDAVAEYVARVFGAVGYWPRVVRREVVISGGSTRRGAWQEVTGDTVAEAVAL